MFSHSGKIPYILNTYRKAIPVYREASYLIPCFATALKLINFLKKDEKKKMPHLRFKLGYLNLEFHVPVVYYFRAMVFTEVM